MMWLLGDVKRYVGNYENLYSNGFILSKRMQEYESQQAEIKRLETFVEKNITCFNKWNGKSRRKILENGTH